MRGLAAALASIAILFTASAPAAACAGLIGSNGAVNLGRTTTLAAYRDGVEHYITAFQFLGGGGQFGTLIPLPGIPSDVQKGGAWTLQRLIRETEPAQRSLFAPLAASVAWDSAQVLLAATDLLLNDLRADEGMAWVPANAWLTKLRIDARVADLTYDLAIDASGSGTPSPVAAGLSVPAAMDPPPAWAVLMLVLTLLGAPVALSVIRDRS